MEINNNTNKRDPLLNLIELAAKKDLQEVVKELCEDNLENRRFCIDSLKEKINENVIRDNSDESSLALDLWYEVEPELSELDEYGGGDYDTEDNVMDCLMNLQDTLHDITLKNNDRKKLLDEVFEYIISRNSGMVDALYDVVYATCKTDNDFRDLAKRFADLNEDWSIHHARNIYRKIGDNRKYLELRLPYMKYGMDYFDLCTFYWDNGEKVKALETAKEGLAKGEGRVSDLQKFLAERAKESGDRELYLSYIFSLKTDRLTLTSYKEFKNECQQKEWEKYEKKIIILLENNPSEETAKIYLYRKEYDKVLHYLNTIKRPYLYSSEIFSITKKLENRYPNEILTFYKNAVRNLDISSSRKYYRENAYAVFRVRRVFIDILKKPDEWKKYAYPIKMINMKRPAFQDEFAKIIPDWHIL